jgi:hypothetical protein
MSLDVYLRINEEEVYSANITHNLAPMAEACGLYKLLWRPDELNILTAEQLAPLVWEGFKCLLQNREELEKLDSPNGWGVYDDFVRFVSGYTRALWQYPTAQVEVSR